MKLAKIVINKILSSKTGKEISKQLFCLVIQHMKKRLSERYKHPSLKNYVEFTSEFINLTEKEFNDDFQLFI
jgi:hypothetical protein